jgi:hypothetical protein
MTLGGDASVAAGPVGRAASAGTDQNFAAEVYSYSRARGLFAGIALDGTSISIDRGANARFYDKHDAPAADIISGNISRNDEATQRFLAVVGRSTSTGGTQATTTPATPESGSGEPAPPPASSSGATTFPMEDPAPGQEPK